MSDLEKMELVPNYTQLDLNADMMREDLDKLGIRIEASNFVENKQRT